MAFFLSLPCNNLAFSTLIKSGFWTFSFTCPQLAEKIFAPNDSIIELQSFGPVETFSSNFKVGEIKGQHLQNYILCVKGYSLGFSLFTQQNCISAVCGHA